MNPLFSRLRTQASPAPVRRLARLLDQADAVVVGAGSGCPPPPGLSTAENASSGTSPTSGPSTAFRICTPGAFFPFPTLEEHWAYWSRMVWVNRYQDAPKPVYQTLRDLLVDKDHFILTTNVDHCFQKGGV